MKIWPFWRYMYLNRIQRWGLFSILLLMLIVIVSELIMTSMKRRYFDGNWNESTNREYALLRHQLDSIQRQREAFFENKAVHESRLTSSLPPKIPVKKLIAIDINKANVMEWKSIPGIGSVLSERIVKYREKLGGFVSIMQVREVYGITDSTFNSIKPLLKCQNYEIKVLNINTSSIELLGEHPYLRSRWGKQMINYRTKVRNFEKVEDVRNLYGMTDSIYTKIAPYLSVD